MRLKKMLSTTSTQQPATGKNGSGPSSANRNEQPETKKKEPGLSSATRNEQPETRNPVVVPGCQHIKADGLRCGSPAMDHGAFCFFHTDVRLRRRHKRIPL